MLIILSGVFIISTAHAVPAVDCTDTATCDQETFTSVAPDAVILLDLSRNMNLNPAGGTNTYGAGTACVADEATCVSGVGNTDPNYGFSAVSTGSCTTVCSRLAIAKRAIFDLLDDDNSNVIDNQDANSLGIRFGLMRFLGGDDYPTEDYNAGFSKLIKEIGTSYQNIYCGASAASGQCVISDTCASGECVANETASGGAGIARALHEAKLYLDDHKTADGDTGACRQKFVVLITSSSEDCSCEGGTDGCLADQCNNGNGSYKRRYQIVGAAKELYDAGYKLFAVGFGSAMPDFLQNTLEWIARWGGTDNPTVINGGTATALTPITYTSVCPSTGIDWGTLTSGTCGGVSIGDWYASQNDPGNATTAPLSGYAFLANNATELAASLKATVATIKDQTFSFTRVSVQTVRTIDENFLYEASFLPLIDSDTTENDPFWIGHLKKYVLNEDGSLPASAEWDAGAILQGVSGASRTIYTYKSGSLANFSSVTPADLGVDMDADPNASRNMIVNFVTNGDTAYDSSIAGEAAKDNWKLGDIFHSSPICVGTPSIYFSDVLDPGDPKAYDTYRDAHPRTSDNGKRLLVAGANDGQFHVFKTGTAGGGGGNELWSFVPPNLLTSLKGIAHSSHPSVLPHQYFVDGPSTASDIYTGTVAHEASKDSGLWKAYMIVSLGRGGSTKLWCTSASCDAGCTDTYSATTNQFCGYYAFDVTETLNAPTYKWHFGGAGGLNATQGDHLGQPWSKITMGRVYINGNEKWVGFAGGGYSGADCKTANNCSRCDKRGKGFYVIDLLDGTILWTYTACGPAGVVNFDMSYSLAGQPASVDTDDDGYIDTVYVADLGNNVWRFKMCTKADYTADAACGIGNWTGGKFYGASSGEIRPIYTKPTVVHTASGDLWVYWGTGDVNDPTASNAQEKFYACKDNDRTTTWSGNDLDNITNGTYDPTSGKNGWYMNLSGSGQKILADPTVYADVVYFTSYTPGNANDPCDRSGAADLFAVDYMTGAGEFDGGARSTSAGSGIASGAVVSENPYGGTNVYVTTSEGSQINVVQPPDPTANRSNLQYWQDMRIQ